MKWIWSDAQDEIVIERFTYDGVEYVWNDVDEVYYDVLCDENYLMEVPEGVIA